MHQLEQLLDLHGVSSNYWNYKGDYVDVPLENRIGLLKAIYSDTSIDFDDPLAIQSLLDSQLLSTNNHLTNPLCIVDSDNCFIDFTITQESQNEAFQLTLSDAKQKIVLDEVIKPDALIEVGKRTIGVQNFMVLRFRFDDLPIGYYSLSVNNAKVSVLAVCPRTCFTPDWILNNEKQSGVIIQLYSLRSNTNFGIGDFEDLVYLINHLSELGFTSVGLNPLHALLPNLEDNYSPYSPSDRRFINILYIALSKFEEYSNVFQALDSNERTELNANLQSLRDNDFIDYAKVKKIKFKLLEKMYLSFIQNKTNAQSEFDEFDEFKRQGGKDLKGYVLLDALSDKLGHEESVTKLKAALSSSSVFDETYLKHQSVCDIYCYAQWLAAKQFESVQSFATQKGMTIGLVNDLAVGADKFGTEVLTNEVLFCNAAAVGAPPDEIAPVGQNWGLPPIDPLEQKKSGYQHFINLLRANMSNCGALRIDHVMGLTRLWWCPPGAHADHGAYIYYPFDDILRILKLESHLNKCAVIGEDLGIVPENFRETLRSANVLSNKVLYFERDGYAVFRHPTNYEPFALAMINNHDVPTLASWWNAEDIALRDELKAIEVGKTADGLRKVRLDEKGNLISHLIYGDCLPKHWHGRDLNEKADQELIFAIIKWASQAQSILFVLQLEDLILMTKPVNVPGTFKEYPNWKRKLTHTLEEIFDNNDVKCLLNDISQRRRSS